MRKLQRVSLWTETELQTYHVDLESRGARKGPGLLNAELEKVDGVGPYSAGAISSIAFGQRAALVDGNVTRVFSRSSLLPRQSTDTHLGLTALHASAPAKATTNFIWALADRLVPAMPKDRSENLPGTWNQAVMELGATVCTAKNPNCEECPIAMHCLAYAEVSVALLRYNGSSDA